MKLRYFNEDALLYMREHDSNTLLSLRDAAARLRRGLETMHDEKCGIEDRMYATVTVPDNLNHLKSALKQAKNACMESSGKELVRFSADLKCNKGFYLFALECLRVIPDGPDPGDGAFCR